MTCAKISANSMDRSSACASAASLQSCFITSLTQSWSSARSGMLLSPQALGAMGCLHTREANGRLVVWRPRLAHRYVSSAAPRQHEVIDQIVADLRPDLLARDRIEVAVDGAVDAAACLLVGNGPEARIRARPARGPFPVRFEGNVVRPEEA